MESSQKDIEIYPTYRMIKFKDYPGLQKILGKISDYFTVEKLNKFPDSSGLNVRLNKAISSGATSFYIYGEDSYCLTLKPGQSFMAGSARESGRYDTDVSILHELLLKQVNCRYKIDEISYSNSFDTIKSSIDEKDFQIGIFLNPPSINDLENICYTGQLMPQKSTYFFPKPCSGLIMYKFDRSP